MTQANDVFTTATHSPLVRHHLDKTRQTLQRHRASGNYDADAATRLLRNNARHACKVHHARATPQLLDNVVRLLHVWCIDKE